MPLRRKWLQLVKENENSLERIENANPTWDPTRDELLLLFTKLGRSEYILTKISDLWKIWYYKPCHQLK